MFTVYLCFTVLVFLPEKAVILYTDFPQLFGRSMILEFESDRTLKLLRL